MTFFDHSLCLFKPLFFRLKGQLAEEVFAELQSTNKTNPQVLLNRIQSLDSEEDRTKHLKSQITLANDVLDLLKINDLLVSFAIHKQEKSNNSGNGSNGSSTLLKK